MKALSKQDLVDALHGASIFASGGGGQMTEGMDYVNRALATGRPITLQAVTAAPPDAVIGTPILLGAVLQTPVEEDPRYRRLPQLGEPPIMKAFHLMEKHLGHPLYGVFPVELGASNLGLAFYVAAMMKDGCVIDADPTGRSVPEKTHSSYAIEGLPCYPITAANEFGESFIVDNIFDDRRAEDVMRAICVASREDISVVDHALPVKQIGPVLNHGTVSKCLAMGKALRTARENGWDAAEAVANINGGKVLFRGIVKGCNWKNEAGFTIGDVSIGGVEKYANRVCKLDFKNEFMAAYIDGELCVTIPEIICMINLESCDTMLNPSHEEGMPVAVVVLRAPDSFLTEKGLKVFGPEYLGLKNPFRSALNQP